MASVQISLESQNDKQRLQEIDESLREKYMDIVLSLDIVYLWNVSKHKHRYKKLVMSDMFELLQKG